VSPANLAPEALAELRSLARNAARSTGFELDSIDVEGDRVLLSLRKGTVSVAAWLRASTGEACFARAGAWSVGYRGDLPPGADELLRALASALEHHPAPRPDCSADVALVYGTDQLEIRVTLACNEHCVFCNSWFGASNLATDLPSAVLLASQARTRGARKLVISGGEPLLVRWLPELAREARRMGFSHICLQTNAVLLSRRGRQAQPAPITSQTHRTPGASEATQSVSSHPFQGSSSPTPWDLLRATAPDEVLVSAHGSTAKVLASVTRRPKLATDHLDGMKRLLASDFQVVVNFVVCRQNLADLPRFVRMLARQPRRPSLLALSFVAPMGLAWDNRHDTIPRYAEAAPAVLSALRLSRSLGIPGVLSEYCAIPTCVLPDLREFADPADELRPIHVPPDKTLLPRCEPCPWKPRCSGVFRRYLEMYGDEIQLLDTPCP